MKLKNVQTTEEISGCIELDPYNELSEHFSSPPRQHLHIVVQLRHDDGEYPRHIFYVLYFADWTLPCLSATALHISPMIHAGSSPLPLCTVCLYCSYFVMFSALLIVDHWFSVTSCRRKSDSLSMALSIHSFPYGPHRCHLLASLIFLPLHSFYSHILGLSLSLYFVYLPSPSTNNPVPLTRSSRTPERRSKRPRLEESEIPRTSHATQAALLQTQDTSWPNQSTDPCFLALHNSFWQRGEHMFVKRLVQIPDPLSLEVEDYSETLDLTIIEHPEGPEQVFPFGLSKLLVVEIYETFWKLLESADQEWRNLLRSPGIDRFSHVHHATIITGQSGIGQYAIVYIFYHFDLSDFILQERRSF